MREGAEVGEAALFPFHGAGGSGDGIPRERERERVEWLAAETSRREKKRGSCPLPGLPLNT
jgi:hypothetical protein